MIMKESSHEQTPILLALALASPFRIILSIVYVSTYTIHMYELLTDALEQALHSL